MSLGVTQPQTGTLEIRKRSNGKVILESAPPQQHEFPLKFLQREVNDVVTGWLVLRTEPPTYYWIQGFGDHGDITASHYPHEVGAPTKRPFWKRWFGG